MAGHDPMDKGERDIPTDIFEEENKIRVIAELPGVNEDDIRLNLNGETLFISASRGALRYRKQVKLPHASENIIGKLYNNGILEVILK
jgi:HSP20 family protein